MGHLHEAAGDTVTYRYCPPASGKHYNGTNVGPIRAGLYGPGDNPIPPGWIHNLEHGALVLLYSCKAPAEGQTAPACTNDGQQKLKDLLARWPDSPICKIPPGALTPVIARFDDMTSPYTALVWDVVLPMTEIDETLLFDFYARNAELYNPEKQCAEPTTVPPAATPTPVPSGTPAVSAAASPAPTTAP
jgi:hypothetical protein